MNHYNIQVLQSMWHDELETQFPLRDKIRHLEQHPFKRGTSREIDQQKILMDASCSRASHLDELIQFHLTQS